MAVTVTARNLGPPHYVNILIFFCNACQDRHETHSRDDADHIAEWVRRHDDEGHVKRNEHTAHLYAEGISYGRL